MERLAGDKHQSRRSTASLDVITDSADVVRGSRGDHRTPGGLYGPWPYRSASRLPSLLYCLGAGEVDLGLHRYVQTVWRGWEMGWTGGERQ